MISKKLLFLYKNNAIKALTYSLKNNGGRGHSGRISNRHRGSSHKKRYRFLDNYKYIFGNSTELAIIRRFEYDPCRKCFLALICYFNGALSYILANEGMFIGQVLGFGAKIPIHIGHVRPILDYSLGSIVSNVEAVPGQGGTYAKAAGSFCLILKKLEKTVLIKLRSSELKLVHKNCLATFGSISNSSLKFLSYTKAGQRRWLGKKSHVRGVAMNPVDHPHGGGEGKTSGGRCSVTPWGVLTKGYPTVRGYKRKIKKLVKF